MIFTILALENNLSLFSIIKRRKKDRSNRRKCSLINFGSVCRNRTRCISVLSAKETKRKEKKEGEGKAGRLL